MRYVGNEVLNTYLLCIRIFYELELFTLRVVLSRDNMFITPHTGCSISLFLDSLFALSIIPEVKDLISGTWNLRTTVETVGILEQG